VWNLGTLPGKASRSLTFTADVVNNVPPTTEIHNIAVVHYNDGATAVQLNSTELNFVIVRSGGLITVEVSPDQQTSAEPGDTVQYAYVITNHGVQAETFDLVCTRAGLSGGNCIVTTTRTTGLIRVNSRRARQVQCRAVAANSG